MQPTPPRPNIGITYIAFGEAARMEAEISMRALRDCLGYTHPIAIASDRPLSNARFIPFDGDPGYGARQVKLHLDLLTPFTQTVYLDADTRPRSDLEPLITPLSAGYDLVIAPSTEQGQRAFWHVDHDERESTLDQIGYTPLQLQAGLMAFNDSAAIHQLFRFWREEYALGAQTEDQAALVRALHRSPVKLWLLSPVLSQSLVLHLFGRLRK